MSSPSITPEAEQRRAEMARLRRGGHTLEAIGQRFNLTRERVRQILAPLDITPVTHEDRYQAWLGESLPKIEELLNNGARFPDISERLAVPVGWVKRAVDENDLRHMLYPVKRPSRPTHTKESMIGLLRRYWQATGQVPSLKAVQVWAEDNNLRCPTYPVWARRFGGFTDACREAGVPAPQRQGHSSRRWSDEDLWEVVKTFVADCQRRKVPPTVAEYSRQHPEGPSFALVRLRLGKWSTVVASIRGNR